MRNTKVKITITDHYRAGAETYILCTKGVNGNVVANSRQLRDARARITSRWASGLTRLSYHGAPGVEYGLDQMFDHTGRKVSFVKMWVA